MFHDYVVHQAQVQAQAKLQAPHDQRPGAEEWDIIVCSTPSPLSHMLQASEELVNWPGLGGLHSHKHV